MHVPFLHTSTELSKNTHRHHVFILMSFKEDGSMHQAMRDEGKPRLGIGGNMGGMFLHIHSQ
jgi:hypothetical protein